MSHDTILVSTDHDIAGDVLLRLDVNLLKTEIGIVSFGKRTRIAGAIDELRRSPSIIPTEQSQHTESLSYSAQSYEGPLVETFTSFTAAKRVARVRA